MDAKCKIIYNSGRANKEFLNAIREANGDKKPSIFAGEIEKHIFGAGYYGWLVGKYGNDWESHL